MMKKAQCKYCNKLYSYRPNKEYCSDICRAKSWREGMNATEIVTPCHYCGVPAETIDHVPPRSARGAIQAMGILGRYPFVEVDACRECNCLLGARPLWTVPDRKKFIKRALARRYRKYLRIPKWENQEIAEMSDRSIMKGYIVSGLIIRELVKQRIKW